MTCGAFNFECSSYIGMLNFQLTPYTHPQNGQTYSEYLLTKEDNLDKNFTDLNFEASEYKDSNAVLRKVL